jgi:hypothetical protein
MLRVVLVNQQFARIDCVVTVGNRLGCAAFAVTFLAIPKGKEASSRLVHADGVFDAVPRKRTGSDKCYLGHESQALFGMGRAGRIKIAPKVRRGPEGLGHP